jgi:hypothetical protein
LQVILPIVTIIYLCLYLTYYQNGATCLFFRQLLYLFYIQGKTFLDRLGDFCANFDKIPNTTETFLRLNRLNQLLHHRDQRSNSNNCPLNRSLELFYSLIHLQENRIVICQPRTNPLTHEWQIEHQFVLMGYFSLIYQV